MSDSERSEPLRRLFEGGDWTRRAGATDARIADAERTLGVALPSDLRELLRWCDGGSGRIGRGDAYLQLYGVGEILEAQESCPAGLVPIGSDGGGDTYALNYRVSTTRPALVALDLISPEESMTPFGYDFRDGIEQLAAAGRVFRIPAVRERADERRAKPPRMDRRNGIARGGAPTLLLHASGVGVIAFGVMARNAVEVAAGVALIGVVSLFGPFRERSAWRRRRRAALARIDSLRTEGAALRDRGRTELKTAEEYQAWVADWHAWRDRATAAVTQLAPSEGEDFRYAGMIRPRPSAEGTYVHLEHAGAISTLTAQLDRLEDIRRISSRS